MCISFICGLFICSIDCLLFVYSYNGNAICTSPHCTCVSLSYSRVVAGGKTTRNPGGLSPIADVEAEEYTYSQTAYSGEPLCPSGESEDIVVNHLLYNVCGTHYCLWCTDL